MALRAPLIVVAVVVCAFFGLAVRQATSENDVRARFAPQAEGPAAARRTETLLDHAAQLRPGTDGELLRAQFALQQGDKAKAHRLFLDVTAREPANVQAWAIGALAFAHSDPAFVARAKAALQHYAPSVPAP